MQLGPLLNVCDDMAEHNEYLLVLIVGVGLDMNIFAICVELRRATEHGQPPTIVHFHLDGARLQATSFQFLSMRYYE